MMAAGLSARLGAAPAQGLILFTAKELAQGYRDGTVLAKPRAEMMPTIDQAERGEGMRLRSQFKRFGNVRVLGLAPGETVTAAVQRLKATGRYVYVEPDYIRHITAVPNDPDFPNQWGLHNDGSAGGIAGADINAEAGWNTRTSASSIIVGIVDTGALTTHQDLVANLWVNPTPGTVTSFASVNDNSGATDMVSETDSLNGLNAVAKSGIPTDDSDVGHGTHVSGIVGAVGNNGVGITGEDWGVQLMELKFIDSTGSGATSDELPCLEYGIAHHVSVFNASFGSQGFSQAEMDAIHAAGQAGIIFVCAAGNSSENVDISPFFPADYPLDNIICVGASDNRDLPVYFSNYGSGTVEIFAPGESIYSTINTSTSAYGYLSGTSMASPMVVGAVALLRAQFPADTYRQTINRVLNSADPNPGLAGKAQTGGRLDLGKALTTAANTPPNALFANRTNLVGLDPYTRSNNADSPAALEGGTPAISGMAGGHPLWWQWTAPEDAMVEIDTSGTGGGLYPGGSTYLTLLGVYTGTSLSSLSLVASNANYSGATDQVEGGNGATMPFSEVTFHTTKGVTYQINVQGQGSASGQTILAINTTPDNDSLATPTVLSGPSASLLDANPFGTLQAGEPKILGNAGGHSLWYSWTASATGPAEVSAYSYDFTPEAAVYTGSDSSFGSLSLVASAAGSAAAGTTTMISECLCSFDATAGTTYLIQVDGVTKNDEGEFIVSVDDARWQATTADAVTCSPAVGPDGTIYVGSNDNSFYALNPDGSTKWSFAAAGVFDTSSAAVGPDGTVYAGGADGNLYAFNPDGSRKWTYTVPTPAASTGLDNGISSSPSLAGDGTLYFKADDGNLYALTSTGALKWAEPVAGFSYAAPSIAPDGTVYIGTDGGLFYAFNPDGTTKWTFTAPVAGEGIYTAAAIDAAGNLYLGTLSGNFYSIDPTGKLRWTCATGDSITSAPALANGAAYFGGYDANLYSVSTSTGAVNWKYPLGAQVRASAPAVDANGTVYIGSYDHNVYAVSAGGSLVRIFATDDVVRSSPVISGTSLYFASEDHKVYAFNLGASAAGSDWPMYQFNAQRIGRNAAASLSITAQPASQTVAPGLPVTLSVVATGPGALSYQWSFNGTAIAGATNSTYTIVAATTADSGSYSVTVTSSSGSITSAGAVLTVGVTVVGPPTGASGRIVNLSARANVGTGSNILIAGFTIQGTGSKTVVLRGVGPTLATAPFNVSGALATPELTLLNAATDATIVTGTAWGGSAALAVAFAQVGAFALPANSLDAAVEQTLPVGGYTSQVTGTGLSTGIALAEIYDADAAGTETTSLTNISARANVGTGANIVIAGFVIGGSQPVQVLMRGVGPSLGAAPFNVSGVLAQPEIDLYDSTQTKIQTNTGWAGSAVLASIFAESGAFALQNGSADAAMVMTLAPGSYTLQLSGQNGTVGVGLVEIYLVP